MRLLGVVSQNGVRHAPVPVLIAGDASRPHTDIE
jgi:nucleotide-binding universal stress UspA family protein